MLRIFLFCVVGFTVPLWAQESNPHSIKEHPRYDVSLDAEAGLIDVRACFPGHRGIRLGSGLKSAVDFLSRKSRQPLNFVASNSRIYLPANQPCIAYAVDLNKARHSRQARKYQKSWVVNNRAWLWRPEGVNTFNLAFNAPSDSTVSVSVPWRAGASGNYFVAGNTPLGWTSRMAFGAIDRQTIDSKGSKLELAIVGVSSSDKRQQIKQWINQAADAVSQLYGRFPVPDAQVLVVGIGKRSEAVPWGEVQRAGQPAVHLFVDQTRPIEEFKRDWTAVHELSHLLIPRIDYRDRWLSEGVASYYQNVARAHAEMLTPEQAWQKLKAGFSRGRTSQSGSLRQSRRTMHTYWGGAAFFFLADLRLRALPTPQTLPQVLDKLQTCCIPGDKMWRAREFTEKLDQLSNTSIFTDLLDNEARRPQFLVGKNFEKLANAQIRKNLNEIFENNSNEDVTKD